MSVPDSKTRSKIALRPSRIISTSLPPSLAARLVLSNVLLVASLLAGKDGLLAPDTRVGVFWVLVRVLACAGLGVLVWEACTGEFGKRFGSRIEWAVLGMSALLLFVQQACLMTALFRLSAVRVVVITHFSTLWLNALVHRESSRKAATIICAIFFSLLSDARFSFSASAIKPVLPGYAVLVLHGLASAGLEHTQGVLAPALGTSVAMLSSTLGATIIALPFYLFRILFFSAYETPAVPVFSLLTLPLLAYTLLFFSPKVTATVRATALPIRHFTVSYASSFLPAMILGPLAFSQYPSWTDLVVGCMMFYGMYPDSSKSLGASPPRTPTTRLVKAYLKTILANPESRKIFYFLMLNLSYMLVQMLYGVWTNSLGLISDAIHMAFDCMAIGMGLFASVMATWPPNERFTYGYGRIETLSGFANGIFLILISIFIVFEAIQRILDPPEMNTNQLLLVSTLGLGVNLFGMFAMGGHHHGHSHSHGHSHDDDSHSHNGHSHSRTVPTNVIHSPTEHSHSHSHSHSPIQSPELRVTFSDHQECPEHEHGHEHGHEHEHEHEHGHGHSHSNGLGHSRNKINGFSHNHAHSPDSSPSQSPISPHTHTHAYEHGFEAQQHSPHFAFPTVTSINHLHTSPDTHEPVPASAPPTMTRHTRAISLQLPPSGSHQHLHPPIIPASQSLNSQLLAHPPPREHQNRHARNASLVPAPSTSVGTHFLLPPSPDATATSPLTPTYQFGHDSHFAVHHHAAHVPNLHDHSHSHGQGHEGHSHNMRGVFLHVMADTLGSVGVIISTLLIQFYGWTGFDPIASLFIAILIAASVLPLVIDTGRILALDVADREGNIEGALSELASIDGLASYSSARFWPKDASTLIGSIHIQLSPSHAGSDSTGPHSSVSRRWAPVDKVVERVDTILRKRITGLEELTIQVEGSVNA